MGFNFNINSITPSTDSGGGGSAVISSLNVTPTTSAQTITAPSGIDGYNPINVSAVTSEIDYNIQPENIRAGITILDVPGIYQGMIETPYEIIDGVISKADGEDGFSFVLPSEVTRIAPNTFENAFTSWKFTSVDLSSLVEVGEGGLAFAFLGNQITSINLNSLSIVYDGGLNTTFADNQITSIDLPNLITVGEAGLDGAFANNQITSVYLFLLSAVGINGLHDAFNSNQLTSVDLPNLTSIRENGLNSAFAFNVTLQTVIFEALTSDSFDSGDESAFNDMLMDDDGVTVHFPSNLQAVIGNWQSVSNGFGGTNTTVLFDLPATE